MLDHLGEKDAARLLLEAAAKTLDLGGTANTSQVGDAVVMAVEESTTAWQMGI